VNYLAVLGLEPYSSIEDIKGRYRSLAKKHHPDFGGNLSYMQEINSAYAHALKNHIPGARPIHIDKDSVEHFYRIIYSDDPKSTVLKFPMKVIDTPTLIHCLIDDQEVNLYINEEFVLPRKIKLKYKNSSIIVSLVHEI
jgi:hypothetical protein